jgi:hypothetical protein
MFVRESHHEAAQDLQGGSTIESRSTPGLWRQGQQVAKDGCLLFLSFQAELVVTPVNIVPSPGHSIYEYYEPSAVVCSLCQT